MTLTKICTTSTTTVGVASFSNVGTIGPASRPPTCRSGGSASRSADRGGAVSLASAADVIAGCMVLFPSSGPYCIATVHLYSDGASLLVYTSTCAKFALQYLWSYALLQFQHECCAITAKHLPRPRLRT